MEKNSAARQKDVQVAWRLFNKRNNLTDTQRTQFERYVLLLKAWNRRANITRILSEAAILSYHFQDSLALASVADLSHYKGICDVGSGGGFPGIPLAILYPEVPVVLLEVNHKKVAFLQEVIKELDLKKCTVCDLDWRTFLRQAPYEIDLFCARASLKLDELVRMFKPSCPYNQAELVYWASRNWVPEAKERPYLVKKERYTLDGQERYLAFFKQVQE